MKVLFIGGTGTISMAISRQLLEQGHELYLINRGNRNMQLPGACREIIVDINQEEEVKSRIAGMEFDVVADFIAFTVPQLERDYRLFKDHTRQFMYISSASAYQKPLSNYRITEGTPLANPYWEYSRNKIACEDYLWKLYREEGFPITIIRPSHTYDERSIPLGVHGDNGSWQVARRMLMGKPVIIHGDGTSLWTMTHNSDFARAFIGLMGNIHALGEAVQITSDESLTWNQIYQSIAAALGVTLQPYYVPSDFLDKCGAYDFKGGLTGDKANTVVFDNAKLKRLVPGFTARKLFHEGIRETVDFVLSHEEYQKADPVFDSFCDQVIQAMDQAVIHVKQFKN